MDVDRMFVTVIRPPGYLHANAFNELAETVALGLRRLGVVAEEKDNFVARDVPTVIFGSHLLSPELLAKLPASAILYNLEQVSIESPWLHPALLETMRRVVTWDYSRRNIEALGTMGVQSRWVPVGSVPEMTRITPHPVQDIDVLFYGSLNPRRVHVIEGLKARGINAVAVYGVYGAERDRLIARAKVVLNLHFYPSNIFEIVRVSHLLANAKAVVAECQHDTEIEDDIKRALVAVPYDALIDACEALVRDDSHRKQMEAAALAVMQARDETRYLSRVLFSPDA